ncbi:MAG: hypothetical protein ACREBR_02960, partial [bacterium]
MNDLGHRAAMTTIGCREMQTLMVKIARSNYTSMNKKKPVHQRGRPFDVAAWQAENADLIRERIGTSPSTKFLKALMFAPRFGLDAAPHMLDIFALDACHLSWGNCTLFSLYGHSSSKNAMCLAHGFINGNEDGEAWDIFLKFVEESYPHLNAPMLTAVSDQDKGLKNAVERRFPLLGHFLCSKHRSENIRKNCKSPALYNFFMDAINSTTTEGLAAIKEIINTSPVITESNRAYVNAVNDNAQYPIARIANCQAKMYGRPTSSTVESMNQANRPMRKVVQLDIYNACLQLVQLEAQRFRSLRTSAHELQHVLVRHAFEQYNKFLNEGRPLAVNTLEANVRAEVTEAGKAYDVI